MFSLNKSGIIKTSLFVIIPGGALAGLIFVWALLVKIPDFGSLENRKVAESTKIYDKTGSVILYDVYGDIKRTYIPFDEIPRNLKNATIAVEDTDFFSHSGVDFLSIIRAFGVNIMSGGIRQGGSTITQQLVKNTFLTPEQTISRKIRELVLSLKIEKKYTKNEILNFYLNEIPYGSSNYGIEAASQSFFGKNAKNLTLTEAAYLAALPKAPTYYSPFGEHREDLDARKNFVLQRMKELNYISEDDYNHAKNEKPVFISQRYQGIKAPHFVMFIKDELAKRYSEETIEKGGLKVITTLDYELQEKAEKIVAEYAKNNEKNFNAKNAGMTAVDPKTGQILVMVGSRDYFDTENEGNFNVTTAKRQPGSAFKPFVYATAFKKGYLPETALFDLKTNFAVPGADAYIPQNYDNIYRGPVSIRNALAQSINVPAVKTLYLSGIKDSISTARDFGITTLTTPDRYGLSLVLGGGEVKLLEMTGAYAAFANNGMLNEITGILEIRDRNGKTIDKFKKRERKALDENTAKMINDILSDNIARAPAFGDNSYLNFPGKKVAAKTGTTNNYRDAWVIGYTPSFSLGVWVGNNDNTSMVKKVAGFIAAPMWHAFFEEAFKKYPQEEFNTSYNFERAEKPVIYGEWRGGKFIGGQLVKQIHSILYWVDKENPFGPAPSNPSSDSQFYNWENPVRAWAASQKLEDDNEDNLKEEDEKDRKKENWPDLKIKDPDENKEFKTDDTITIKIEDNSHFDLKQIDIFFKDTYLGSLDKNSDSDEYQFSFKLSNFSDMQEKEKILIKAYDVKGNSNTFEREIRIIQN